MRVLGYLVDLTVSMNNPGDLLQQNCLSQDDSTHPHQACGNSSIGFEDGHNVLYDVENPVVEGNGPLGHGVRHLSL